MILLRLISWPYFRKHVVRTTLTASGIVLGVAVFVGMHIANQRVVAAFSQTVDRISGRTQLQVTAGETGFGEDVLDIVQSARTVRVAVPIVEAVVDPNIKGQGSLLVLGVDMTGDRSLREYDVEDNAEAAIDDPLIFLAQPDSLMLSKDFADRNGIAAGSRLLLGTAEGVKPFTVRGIMKTSGLASAFGGNLAVMDIYAAQKTFGRGRTFDRIELGIKPGVTIADCQLELRQLLGRGFEIRPPSSRGQQFEAMLAGYSIMVNISSAFALFIGMFIIYNSFSIAVTQRRADIGILRALGATRGQIRWLFLGESAVLGVVGSTAGLAVGATVARAIAAFIGGLIADVYGVAQRTDALATDPKLLMFAFAIGVVTSLAAAVVPAWNAARVDPVQALQKGKYQVLSAGESRLRAIAATLLAAVSAACVATRGSRSTFYVGYGSLIVGALLLAPLLSLGLARLIRPALAWLRPVEGALAADSLIQAPRRTSATVAALMLSLALVVAFEGMARASYESIVAWMDGALNPDLFVLPSQSLDITTTRFPATVGQEIAAISGVRRVQMVRNGRVAFRQGSAMVVAIEMDSLAETDTRPPVAGNAAEMYRTCAAGRGVMVSDNFARLQNLRLGDTIEIPAPYGIVQLPVTGVVLDYSDQQGSIILDRKLFIKYWHDDSVNAVRVYVADGTSAFDVRHRILETSAGRRQTFVLTNAELKTYIRKVAGQWFGLTSVQITAAVLVAVLGIVNTLTVSITDRRRELGVLRAVGASHPQIRRTIWLEAVGIAVIGLILGCTLGAINLYYVLQIVDRDIAGMRLDYRLPGGVMLGLVPIIVAAGLVSALWPAESALRGSLVEALEYE